MENSQRNETIHHNLAETMREIARRSDGVVLERQGLLLYAAGPSTPALWNGAIRVDPGLGTTEILAMAGDFFGDLVLFHKTDIDFSGM